MRRALINYDVVSLTASIQMYGTCTCISNPCACTCTCKHPCRVISIANCLLPWMYYVMPFLSCTGTNVQRVLALLDVLDKHSFFSCRAHNPLTTLYCALSAAQCSFEVPLSDEMLAMLLCQWAVTPYRSGEHRPLVVAMLLRQRQDDVMKVRGEL